MDYTALTTEQLTAQLEQAKVDAKGLSFAYDNLDDLHQAEARNEALQDALRGELARRAV